MPPTNRIPTSFSQVYHHDNWKLIRDYGVPQSKKNVEDAQLHLQLTGPQSRASSGTWPSSQQTPAAVASHASLVETFAEQTPPFYQPLPIQEEAPSRAWPSPASTIRIPHWPQIPHPSFSSLSNVQSNLLGFDPFVDAPVHPSSGTPTSQHHVPTWNTSRQPSTTYPSAQKSPGKDGAVPHDPTCAQTPPTSPSAIQYRFTLVPILVNGIVYHCWFPLPESISTSPPRSEDQTSPFAGNIPEPPAPRNFQPTNMVLEQNGVNPTFPRAELHSEVSSYQGDLGSEANRRQVHQLPDNHNCTLWLWNIPAALHISDIFDQVDTGAVQCCHIVPPNADHITCAAKLAFMSPDSAARFKQKIDSAEGVWLSGIKLMARFNRDGNLRNDTHQSRVLMIEGPSEFMTSQYWEAYFQKICVFQWDRVLELPCQDPNKKILQFSFARLDGQAQACMGAIRNQAEFNGIIRAIFAPDRCGSAAVREVERNYRRLY